MSLQIYKIKNHGSYYINNNDIYKLGTGGSKPKPEPEEEKILITDYICTSLDYKFNNAPVLITDNQTSQNEYNRWIEDVIYSYYLCLRDVKNKQDYENEFLIKIEYFIILNDRDIYNLNLLLYFIKYLNDNKGLLISNDEYINNYPKFLGGIDINKKISYNILVESINNTTSLSKLNIINNYFRKIAVTYNLKNQGVIIQLINDKEIVLLQPSQVEDDEQSSGIINAMTTPSEPLQQELVGGEDSSEDENGL